MSEDAMNAEVEATAVAEVEVVDTVEADVAEVETTEDAVEAPKKRRGKVSTKAQIGSVEDAVAFVRGNTDDEAVIKRLKEVFAAKFAEQKEMIIDSMWPAINKATPKKQAWYTENVISKIRNARKPKF